jgi:hypothetical protein
VQDPKMQRMAAQVLQLPRRPPRRRRPRPRPMAATSACTGRAWINGREVGGTDPRYAYLATGSD